MVGGDNIEGLLISPKALPFKNLEVGQSSSYRSCLICPSNLCIHFSKFLPVLVNLK